MKKLFVITLFFAVLMTACSTPAASANKVDAPGNSPGNLSTADELSQVNDSEEVTQNSDTDDRLVDHEPALQSVGRQSSDLTQEEIEALVFMREEEKLAQDVYLTLYEMWGLKNFQNIARSETKHMQAVLNLMDHYQVEDPAVNNGQGEFVNTGLQPLYDQLIQQGSISLNEALKVGAAIEEIDILDLRLRIDQTSKENIINVYQNLLRGSENHLRSFVKNLQQRTGEVYVPQYLSQSGYEEIASSLPASGNQDSRKPATGNTGMGRGQGKGAQGN